MKFLDSLSEHRFHVFGVGISYANMIGWAIGFAVAVIIFN